MNNTIPKINQDNQSKGISSETSLKVTKVIKDGHEYTHIEHTLSWRVTRVFQALALTILTLGIGLCFSFVREKWTQAFSGKEIKIKKIPEEEDQSIQNTATKQLKNSHGTQKNENENSSKSEKTQSTHPSDTSLDPQISSQENVESKLDPSKLENAAAESELPPVQEESTIKKMIESGVIKESKQANSILKDHIGEKWLTLHHIDAFENLTELDLSNVSYPVSKELIQTILDKCKQIKIIKGYISEYHNEFVKPNNSPGNEDKSQFTTPSKLTQFLLENKNLHPFMQIPNPKFLKNLFPKILSDIVILASQKEDVDSFKNFIKDIFQNVCENYLQLFLTDILKRKEFKNELLILFFDQKSSIINQCIFKYGNLEQVESFTKMVKSLSPLKKMSNVKGINEEVQIEISPRTSALCDGVNRLTTLFGVQKSIGNYEILLENESEESIKEIIEYFSNNSIFPKINMFTKMIFLYLIIKSFDKAHQEKVLNSLPNSLSQNLNLSQSIAKSCHPNMIPQLFSNILKYYSGTGMAHTFISYFVGEILKLDDPKKINAVFKEFWPSVLQFDFNENKYQILAAGSKWLQRVDNLETYKLVLESIPDNLDHSLLDEITNSLIKHIHMLLADGIETQDIKKVIEELGNGKIKNMLLNKFNE